MIQNKFIRRKTLADSLPDIVSQIFFDLGRRLWKRFEDLRTPRNFQLDDVSLRLCSEQADIKNVLHAKHEEFICLSYPKSSSIENNPDRLFFFATGPW